MITTWPFRLGIYFFCLVIGLLQCVNGMEKEASTYTLLLSQEMDMYNRLKVQRFMCEYKRGYPEPSLYSLEAGLDLLQSGTLNLYKERELVANLLSQTEQLHRIDPTGVEKLIWSHYDQLMPSVKALFEKWVQGRRRCYRCKVTTACFILGTIIFSCSGFVMQLFTHPESIAQLGYCDIYGHDGLFPACFTVNDTI